WHQAATADHHVRLHHRSVHDDRAHSHQHPILDRAPVQYHLVSYGDIVAHMGGKAAWVEGTGVGDMYDSAVLDVAAGANADFVNIATNDNQRPHRAVRAYFHISDHDGGGIDESGGVNAGRLVLKNTHCHGKHLCRD